MTTGMRRFNDIVKAHPCDDEKSSETSSTESAPSDVPFMREKGVVDLKGKQAVEAEFCQLFAPQSLSGDMTAGKVNFSSATRGSRDLGTPDRSLKTLAQTAVPFPDTRPGAVRVIPADGSHFEEESVHVDTARSMGVPSGSDLVFVAASEAMRRADLETQARLQILEAAIEPSSIQMESDVEERAISKPRRLRCALLFVVVLLVAIGLAVGLAKPSERSNHSVPTPMTQDPSPHVPSHSLAPSRAPGMAGPASSLKERIRNAKLTGFPEEALDNPSSPPGRALSWICGRDADGDGTPDIDCDDPSDPEAAVELFALLVPFFRPNNDQGRLSLFQSTSACSYPGVLCNANTGYVERLDLSNHGIIGPALLEFGLFRRVEVVILANNPDMTGPIPDAWVESWKNITTLDLSNTGLQGEFPAGFADRDLLTTIRIEGTQMTGNIPPAICTLLENKEPRDFRANCLGGIRDRPQTDLVHCPCCTTCCDPEGKNCD